MVIELSIKTKTTYLKPADFRKVDLDNEKDAEFFKAKFGAEIYQALLNMESGGELAFFITWRD